jgi:ABC-2 type transport system ATP-binding protein
LSAIVCRQLTKSYGAFPVLKGIDLEVERGEMFGFLGPNGAGKTTTIKILTGLLLPSGGQVEVAGWDVVEDPFEVKRRVGYVPDRAYLYDKLTGGEFLEFVGHLYGLPPGMASREAGPYLEMFDLSGWADELIEAYSHGMRQKLAVTAALLHRPEVLVIDEPMVGLDPRSARRVKTLLKRLVDNGTTVFLSTHTLEVAEALCTRVAILQQGRILALGTIDELRRQAMHDDGSLESIFLRLTEEEPVT